LVIDNPLSEWPDRQAEQNGAVNPPAIYFPVGVFDHFLDESIARSLLDFAIANKSDFVPASVDRTGLREVNAAARRSYDYAGSKVTWSAPLERALRDHAGDLAAASGLAPFAVGPIEPSLSAYRDGCFYADHLDAIGSHNGGRLLSAVFYVHRTPTGFTGGKLEFAPLTGTGAPMSIEPRHNRLVVFRSIARHRVAPVSVAGDRFADARFSVNCFVGRAA
jgi:SM-20-related protein